MSLPQAMNALTRRIELYQFTLTNAMAHNTEINMTNFIHPPQLKLWKSEHSSLQTGIISSAIVLIEMRCLTEAAKTKSLLLTSTLPNGYMFLVIPRWQPHFQIA